MDGDEYSEQLIHAKILRFSEHGTAPPLAKTMEVEINKVLADAEKNNLLFAGIHHTTNVDVIEGMTSEVHTYTLIFQRKVILEVTPQARVNDGPQTAN